MKDMSIANASTAHPLRTNTNDTPTVNSATHGGKSLTMANTTSSEKLLKSGLARRTTTTSFMSRFRRRPAYIPSVSEANIKNGNSKMEAREVPADQRTVAAEIGSSIDREMYREIEIAWIHAKSAGIDSCEEKNVDIIRNAISHRIDNMAMKYKEVYDRAYQRARSSQENFVLASLLSAHKPALRAAERYRQDAWLPQEACGAAIAVFKGEMYKAQVRFLERHIDYFKAIAAQRLSMEAPKSSNIQRLMQFFGKNKSTREPLPKPDISPPEDVQAIQPEGQTASPGTLQTFTLDRSWGTWAIGDKSQFGGRRIVYDRL